MTGLESGHSALSGEACEQVKSWITSLLRKHLYTARGLACLSPLTITAELASHRQDVSYLFYYSPSIKSWLTCSNRSWDGVEQQRGKGPQNLMRSTAGQPQDCHTHDSLAGVQHSLRVKETEQVSIR